MSVNFGPALIQHGVLGLEPHMGLTRALVRVSPLNNVAHGFKYIHYTMLVSRESSEI